MAKWSETVEKWSNYTAFGQTMPGRNFNQNESRYGYQGSEKDVELNPNIYTTHFRELDTRLGRWWSIDPKANASVSPYASMDNSPIWKNDVAGDTISFNFFASWGGHLFNKVTSLFIKKQVNDGVFAVFGHGTQFTLFKNNEPADAKANNEPLINNLNTPEEVIAQLSKQSKEFRSAMKRGDKITLILYACNTGNDAPDIDINTGKPGTVPNTPIGEDISGKYKNITVVAPDGDVNYMYDSKDEKYKIKGVTNETKTGGWITYQNGKKVSKTFQSYDPDKGTVIRKGEKTYGTSTDQPKASEKRTPKED